MGDVMGDPLNRRRGIVQGMEDSASGKVINAEVPLSGNVSAIPLICAQPRRAGPLDSDGTMEFTKYAEDCLEAIKLTPLSKRDQRRPALFRVWG